MKLFLIQADLTNPVLEYAAKELSWMIEAITACRVTMNKKISGASATVTLKIMPSLPKAAFELRPVPGSCKIELRGQNASAVLSAVYTFLELAGVYFEASGPVLPEKPHLKKALSTRKRVVPAVIERGIRQHINFTMDISSYPLNEAREYIRNLARMRFNHITFHSYPKQWYSYETTAGEKITGGYFFYGSRHDLPELPEVREKICNRKVFCIPEIEPVYDDIARREAAAIEWLNNVMNEAKRAGMTVQFSTEYSSNSAEDGLRACESMLTAYPMIDVLELLTPENQHKTEERLSLYLESFRLLKERKRGKPLPRLATGIYDTDLDPLSKGIAVLRKKCPADIECVVLPAHGARKVVENMQELKLKGADWKKMRMYSWIEFDGLMYLQQNALTGSRMAVDYLKKMAGKNRQVFGIDFNHWRTEENLMAIRYAAEICLDSRQSPAQFARTYATANGIGTPALFAKAMLLLDDTDTFCRDNLFNFGFCWLGCWNCFEGLGRIEGWKTENQQIALTNMREIRRMLEQVLESTTGLHGRTRVRFMLNRIECTILHFLAVGEFCALRDYFGTATPGGLTAEQADQTRQCCERATAFAEDYMRLHSRAMPDRGCEGTVVSYAQTLYGYVDSIRKKMLGEDSNECRILSESGEAPPPPEG